MKLLLLTFLGGLCLVTACQRGAGQVGSVNSKLVQAHALVENADKLYQSQEYASAIRHYDLALVLNPGNAMTWCSRGNVKFRTRDLAGALADYDRAIRLDANFADAYYNRATACFDAADYAEAVAYCATLRLSAQRPDALYNRGAAYYKLGNFKEALTDFDRIIDLQPDFATVYNYRSKVKHALGNHPGALADYQTSLRLLRLHAPPLAERVGKL